MGINLLFLWLFIFIQPNFADDTKTDCTQKILEQQNQVVLYKAEQIAKKMQQSCPNIAECDVNSVMESAIDLISDDLVNPISLPSHILRKSTHVLFNVILLFSPPVLIHIIFPDAPESLKVILSVPFMFATQRLFGRWDYPWGYPFEAWIERFSYRWFGSHTRFSKINKQLTETARLETGQIYHMKANYLEYLMPIKKHLRMWEAETNPENKKTILKKVARLFGRAILDCKELFGGLNLNDSSVLRDVRRLFPQNLVSFKNVTTESVLLRLQFFREFIPLVHEYIHGLPKDSIDENLDRQEVTIFGTSVLIQWLYGKDHSFLEDLRLLINTP